MLSRWRVDRAFWLLILVCLPLVVALGCQEKLATEAEKRAAAEALEKQLAAERKAEQQRVEEAERARQQASIGEALKKLKGETEPQKRVARARKIGPEYVQIAELGGSVWIEGEDKDWVKTVSLDGPGEIVKHQLIILKDLKQVRRLILHGGQITEGGRFTEQQLSPLMELTQLEYLNLVGRLMVTDGANKQETDDAGVKHLKGLRQLRELSLEHTRVTDEGLAVLASLTGLQSLNLTGCNRVTDAGVRGLQEALPKLKIMRGQ